MANRLAPAHFLSALLALVIAGMFAFPGSPQGAGRTSGILLSVEKGETSGNFFVEPIAVMNHGAFEKPPDSCAANNPEAQRFQSSYFRTGRTYHLLFGGMHVGTITISPPIANFAGGIAELNGSLVLQDGEMALATDASTLGNRESYRRAPDSEEHAAAELFAKNMFRGTGSHDDSLGRMQLDSLTVTKLNHGGEPALIGTAEVAAEGLSKGNRFIFFVATKAKNADVYSPSFIWYNHPEGDAEAEKLQLVDVIDLDGDSINELVVVVSYLENHRFQIFKVASGAAHSSGSPAWQKIYESANLGCK
jgi:hypothetical protein